MNGHGRRAGAGGRRHAGMRERGVSVLGILLGSGQILRPKLLSGLESLPASPTRSMVSHPTPSSSTPPSSPPLPSSCERHCRVCGDSKLARHRRRRLACLLSPSPSRPFVVVFSLLAFRSLARARSFVHGEYRTSGTRARFSVPGGIGGKGERGRGAE